MALSNRESWRYLADTEADALAYLRGLDGDPFPTAYFDDAVLLDGLEVAVAELERATARWFTARTGTMSLRGEGGEVLWLTAPILDLTAASIDGEALDLDDLDVNVYDEDAMADPSGDTDPRDDPFIRFKRPATSYLITLAGGVAGVWPKADRGRVISLTGTFGYCDLDSSGNLITPRPVRGALLLLLQRRVVSYADEGGQAELRSRGSILMEMTRGRSYQLAQAKLSDGVFQDREIDRIVTAYKAPPRVTISRSRRRVKGASGW